MGGHDAGLGIDLDAFHRREVEHDAPVNGAEARYVALSGRTYFAKLTDTDFVSVVDLPCLADEALEAAGRALVVPCG